VFVVFGVVDCAVDFEGVAAEGFHEVDFAAGGPGEFVDAGAEEPDGGPHALSFGDFGAGFEAAVGPGEFVLGGEHGGGVGDGFLFGVGGGVGVVFGVGEIFAAGFDEEEAVFDADVFGAVAGVDLGFAGGVEAGDDVPFGGVGAAGGVEFVGPDELPIGSAKGGGEAEEGEEEILHGSHLA